MKLNDIRNLLPANGLRAIAERTSISYTELTRMFRGLKTKQTPIVLKGTLDYLNELENKQKDAKEALKAAIADRDVL